MIPSIKHGVGERAADAREVRNGIVHVLSTGCRWADAPPVYGLRQTLDNRFVRWPANGIWTDIFHAMASAGGRPNIFAERANRVPMPAEPPIPPTVVAIQHWIARCVEILDTSISETTLPIH